MGGARTIPEFPKRLAEVLHTFGSVNAAAKAIDRSEGALRKWLSGRSQPVASDIYRLCALTGFSAEWLLFGSQSSTGASASVRESSPRSG